MHTGTFASKDRGQRPRHTSAPPPSESKFSLSGDIVRESGIYEVIHEGPHRDSHEVVLLASDLFPSCDICSERVLFRLVRSAPYIFTDRDFEKPE
jgi:hypothetical protein